MYIYILLKAVQNKVIFHFYKTRSVINHSEQYLLFEVRPSFQCLKVSTPLYYQTVLCAYGNGTNQKANHSISFCSLMFPSTRRLEVQFSVTWHLFVVEKVNSFRVRFDKTSDPLRLATM